jgi:hypothetical protein
MKNVRLIGLVFLVLLAACGTADVGKPDAADSSAAPAVTTSVAEELLPPSEEDTTQPNATEQQPVALHSNPQVAIAVADLSTRLGVEVGAIAVNLVEEVTWRDGSLGCPEPGIGYTQALVDGRRIVLDVYGVEYVYHSGS